MTISTPSKYRVITLPPVGLRNIEISVSVYVCMSALDSSSFLHYVTLVCLRMVINVN